MTRSGLPEFTANVDIQRQAKVAIELVEAANIVRFYYREACEWAHPEELDDTVDLETVSTACL